MAPDRLPSTDPSSPRTGLGWLVVAVVLVLALSILTPASESRTAASDLAAVAVELQPCDVAEASGAGCAAIACPTCILPGAAPARAGALAADPVHPSRTRVAASSPPQPAFRPPIVVA